jgi:hypothetical protein
MEAMRQSWTDDRLDDLNRNVDGRFDQVNRRFDQVDDRFDRVEGELREFRGEMNEMRSEINRRFDSMQRSMMYGAIALSSAMLAGFAAMVGLVATQL